jgi:hypothetical protein
MHPFKISVVALFRAWADPVKEVEEPFDQLANWALPIKLSNDGVIMSTINAAKNATSVGGALEAMATEGIMPSLAPTLIAMTYKGRMYSPLVIESIQDPLGSPVNRKGQFVERLVPMTLCSLTAFDREDWNAMKRQTFGL